MVNSNLSMKSKIIALLDDDQVQEKLSEVIHSLLSARRLPANPESVLLLQQHILERDPHVCAQERLVGLEPLATVQVRGNMKTNEMKKENQRLSRALADYLVEAEARAIKRLYPKGYPEHGASLNVGKKTRHGIAPGDSPTHSPRVPHR